MCALVCMRALPQLREQNGPRFLCVAEQVGHIFSLYRDILGSINANLYLVTTAITTRETRLNSITIRFNTIFRSGTIGVFILQPPVAGQNGVCPFLWAFL